MQMSDFYPFSNYEQFQIWLESTGTTDEYCFIKQPVKVRCDDGVQTITTPEEPEEIIKRLDHNIRLYRTYMVNHVKLPKWVHDHRAEEFERLRNLRTNT